MAEAWLLDEVKPPSKAALFDLEGALLATPGGNKRAALAENVPHLAVRIPEMIIHDNKQWFGGEADIRLDALVVHGYVEEGKPRGFYMPGTFRFARVADGDHLPIGKPGLLIFHGKPLYFLDIFLTVSRDVKDSEDLSTLLVKNLKSPEVQGALETLVGLAVATPHAAITTALGAAVVLGDFACQILRKVTGHTVGLYRNAYLQFPDGFGVGRHPEVGVHKVKDLSFSYEIVIAEKSPNDA